MGHPSIISKACKGVNKTAGRYEWCYFNEYKIGLN